MKTHAHAFSQAFDAPCQTAGKLGIVFFDEADNVWDEHRGRPLESHLVPSATQARALSKLARMLRQAKWRTSSRVNYNAWFRSWLNFALVNKYRALPAKSKHFTNFLVLLACHYAASTVQVAAAAVHAIHRLNGCKPPLKDCERLQDIMTGIEKCGIVGTRCPKYIVDSNFVAKMVSDFTAEFPSFIPRLFDPRATTTGDADRSIMWLRGTGTTIFGLELGVRPSSINKLTTCCWQPRADSSVAVQVDLAKNGKNGVVFAPVLTRVDGSFKENGSAISFAEEYLFPFLESVGANYVSAECDKKSWRTAHCHKCPKLFSVFRQGSVEKFKAISAGEVSSMVKKWAAKIGRDPRNYSGVSLRRGSTSIAAAMKVAKAIRKKHGGWASDRMPDVYTEVSTSEQKQVGKAIHKAVKKSLRNRSKKVQFNQ